MKKMISVLLALMLLVGLLPTAVLAEADDTPDLAGMWIDPAFDRAEFIILHDYEGWAADLLDEKPNDGYFISMNWSNSADSYDHYQMIARQEGNKLVYDKSIYIRYTAAGEGEDAQVKAEVLDEQGKGVFTLQEDGTLLWEDSYVKDAAEMKLGLSSVEAPSAEELAERYFKPIAALETETAGAELKKAQAVLDTYAFCIDNAVWQMDKETLRENMLTAFESLTQEEQAAFDRIEPEITEEALRLLKEDEKLTEAYTDAGVAERLETLREDPTIRSSLGLFLAYVMTLGNSEEP